jgi:hypothetical protein
MILSRKKFLPDIIDVFWFSNKKNNSRYFVSIHLCTQTR